MRALAVVMMIACAACGGRDLTADAGAPTPDSGTSIPDAGMAPPAPGTPDAGVWFDTSVGIRASIETYSDGSVVGPGAPSTDNYSCVSLARASMTADQLAWLAAEHLIRLNLYNSSDGFTCEKLIILDADGGTATYGVAECPSFQLPGAQAMLPDDPWAEFSGSDGGCP